MQRKKHSREEIATKLSKADELHELGKTQAEIARTLGRRQCHDLTSAGARLGASPGLMELAYQIFHNPQ
jgi:hypothetical protein